MASTGGSGGEASPTAQAMVAEPSSAAAAAAAAASTFDPTKLMAIADQLKAVMDAQENEGELDEELMRKAMEQTMDFYNDFQRQFGGELSEALPAEDFEALQVRRLPWRREAVRRRGGAAMRQRPNHEMD